MPITLPVPGGTQGATTPSTYYSGTNLGEYQFVSLSEIVENFIATYIGEGKILANTLKGDVNFHAHRALQELHYDTLKSCKSQEIEVCPSLKMPLPHDYVNYVKLTSVDGNGIEHVLYPTRHTSNPFGISQDGSCGYNTDGNGLVEQSISTDGVTVECDPASYYLHDWATFLVTNWDWQPGSGFCVGGGLCTPNNTYSTTIGGIDYNLIDGNTAFINYMIAIAQWCDCVGGIFSNDTCGSLNYSNWGGALGDEVPFDGVDFDGWFTNTNVVLGNNFPTVTGTNVSTTENTSNTWDQYSSSTASSVSIDTSLSSNASVDNDNRFGNFGKRYGMDTQFAQSNGSYFIDCMRGNIHFSSNLSGKTIILKYISDGHGTDNEMIVPKLAEEAMYKWIAYGCLSARADVPENLVQRYKREKFAETRKAKIRLSNIKIEEISQIIRGKSKWIKH